MCGRGGERRECVAGQNGGTAMACGWLAGSGPTGCLRQLGASSQTDQPCALHRYTHLVNAILLPVHTVALPHVGRQFAHSQHNISGGNGALCMYRAGGGGSRVSRSPPLVCVNPSC